MSDIPERIGRKPGFDAVTAKKVLIFTVLFCLVAHSYRYFNAMFSHDSLMIHQDDLDFQIGLGRFLQPLYLLLRGNLCSPLLIGLFSVLWLSASVYIIIKVFDFKSTPCIVIICGLMATNATVTFAAASYLPWADIYMLSLLAAAAAVYVFDRCKFGFLFGAVLIAVSLALYQSYFQAAVMMLMMLIVKNIFDGATSKEAVKKGLKALLMLLAGLLLYYAAFRLVLMCTGLSVATTYNGVADVGNYNDVSLPALIADTYIFPVIRFLRPETYNRYFIAGINAVIFVLSCIGGVRVALAKKLSLSNRILLTALVALMPFGMNVVSFISKGLNHSLMTFSFSLLYVFALMIFSYYRKLPPKEKKPAEKRLRHPSLLNCVAVLAAVIILNSVIFSNQLYLKKDLEYQATLSAMTRIIDRIEQTEGYEVNKTPVVIVGTLSESALAETREGFESTVGIGAYYDYSVTYTITYKEYFENVLSYPISLVAEDEIVSEYAQRPEVQAMPEFPAAGSCVMFDGTLVVKLS